LRISSTCDTENDMIPVMKFSKVDEHV